jgi:hypothetical protein
VTLAPIEVREASVEAVADGIKRYLPAGIGILVIGLPICVFATFAHFVLGVSTSATAGVGTLASVVHQLIRLRGLR